MPMNGLRRNDDAMKNRRWYQKEIARISANYTNSETIIIRVIR
jgi:hypothetical protein